MNIKENEPGGDIFKKKKNEFRTPAEVSILVSCGKGQFCFGSQLSAKKVIPILFMA